MRGRVVVKCLITACFVGFLCHDDVKAASFSVNFLRCRELAGIQTKAISMLPTVVPDSLGAADRTGTQLFASIHGDRLQKRGSTGFGYQVTMKGLFCGVEHICQLENICKHLRFGAIAGYIGGGAYFSALSDKAKKKADAQEIISGTALVGYDVLGENDLPININFWGGIYYSKNDIHEYIYIFQEKIGAKGKFGAIEVVKILHGKNGVQIGPWTLLNYNHARLKQSGSCANIYNFFDGTFGFALKSEHQAFISRDHGFHLKCGCQCRLVPEQSNELRVSFQQIPNYVARNSFVLASGLRVAMKPGWEFAATLRTVLSKDEKTCAASLRLEYNF
ncbi:MAG: hypothetical protein LBD72_03600 [Puniceicoccales bacterium]|nr:hypothetical protein [Puniceicoccales bacterium]